MVVYLENQISVGYGICLILTSKQGEAQKPKKNVVTNTIHSALSVNDDVSLMNFSVFLSDCSPTEPGGGFIPKFPIEMDDLIFMNQ